MDEKPRKPPTNRAGVLIIVLTIAAVLYVLSIGPASALVLNSTISLAAYNCIYAPILALCNLEPVNQLVDWYIVLWYDVLGI